jgi:hypothetical protein
MTTARTEQTDERAVFFHWITGADGLDHAVLEPELTLATTVGASVGLPRPVSVLGHSRRPPQPAAALLRGLREQAAL